MEFRVDDLAAATFVPYHDDGAVNYAGVDAHARDLAAHGVLIAFSTRAHPPRRFRGGKPSKTRRIP